MNSKENFYSNQKSNLNYDEEGNAFYTDEEGKKIYTNNNTLDTENFQGGNYYKNGEIRQTKVLVNEKGEEVKDENGNLVYVFEDTGEEVKRTPKSNNNNNNNKIGQPSKDEFLIEFEQSCNKEFNEIKDNITQEEINKILQEKRTKMNFHLLKILSEERIKEEERENLFVNCLDLMEKKKLQKNISIERTLSTEKVTKLNE